jgi:hypothetical protein
MCLEAWMQGKGHVVYIKGFLTAGGSESLERSEQQCLLALAV